VDVGDKVNVAGYEFMFKGAKEIVGPNYLAARADVEVWNRGRWLRALHPEKRVYNASQSATTETAIDTGLFRDLYLSLGEPQGAGAWTMRIQYKPFVGWIWGGAILMAIGGGLAVSDRRYVQAVSRQPERAQGSEERRPVPTPVGLSGARL
jgi:cytochrome c-type biogenesis protein CcmF